MFIHVSRVVTELLVTLVSYWYSYGHKVGLIRRSQGQRVYTYAFDLVYAVVRVCVQNRIDRGQDGCSSHTPGPASRRESGCKQLIFP